MIGIPNIPTIGKIGNIDVNAWIQLVLQARTTGKDLLEELRNQIRNDPRLAALVTTLEGLLGQPLGGISDEEIRRLSNHWNSLNSATVRDLPKEEEPPHPPPPPAPTVFPYGVRLTAIPPRLRNDAHLLKSGDVVWRYGRQQAMWVVKSAEDQTRHAAPDADPEWIEEFTMP
jgi:hypothetical protein